MAGWVSYLLSSGFPPLSSAVPLFYSIGRPILRDPSKIHKSTQSLQGVGRSPPMPYCGGDPTATNPMTLPEFAYPDQHRYGIPDYANRLAARILEDLEHDDLMDADDYDRRRARPKFLD